MRKLIALGLSLFSAAMATPATARVDLTASVRMFNTRYSFENGKKNPFAGWHDASVTFLTGTEIEAMAKQDPSLAKTTQMIFTASKMYAIVSQRAPDGSAVTNIAEFDRPPEPCGETFDSLCLGQRLVEIRAADYRYHVFHICVNGHSC